MDMVDTNSMDMVDTFLFKEVRHALERCHRCLDDYGKNYYSVTDLAERFGTSRITAYTPPGHQGKWINRFMKHGQSGFHRRSRRPHPGCTCGASTSGPVCQDRSSRPLGIGPLLIYLI